MTDTISFNVCIVGDEELAGQLGKKGSDTEIRMFNYKKGDRAITIAYPHRFPDRIQSLIQSAGISEFCVLVVENPDRAFGEAILALDALGMKNGYIILKNYLSLDQIAPFIKDTLVEGYAVFEGDTNALREDLFERIDAEKEYDGAPVVLIDQAFPVKGIGTVALGVVRSNSVKKHDQLIVQPSGKTAQVKSIQVHDNDVPRAVCGSRVGLALKNISHEDISKGDVASTDVMETAEKLRVTMKVSKYLKEGLKEGDLLHISSGLQFIPGKISSGSLSAGAEGPLELELEKSIVLYPGCNVAAFHLDRFPRVAGRILDVEKR